MRSLFYLLLIIPVSMAAQASIIRDAEIERVLKDISQPIFRAADLPANNINMYIVNDPAINAYVSGGMNIFVHTGLIAKSPTPDMVQGVIAHETGHIAGGHLTKNTEEFRQSYLKTALGYALGIAAAAAGGPQAGAAVAAGATHVTERQLLKYTRTHEEAADQAALNYLDSLGYSSSGLVKLLALLRRQEKERLGEIDPYAVTHPLSGSRIIHVTNHVQNSPYKNKGLPKELVFRYKMAYAKLKAFLQPPEETLIDYPESDRSAPAHYARAIANYKVPNLNASLQGMDGLIKEMPDNPYLYDTKGQILFENGKVAEAANYYRKAISLAPDEKLLPIQLGAVLVAAEDTSKLDEAIRQLEYGLTFEKRNAFGWKQLGIAYGRKEDLGMSYLALAQHAALVGNKKDVTLFTNTAKDYLKEGSPAWLRLQDIIRAAKDDK